MLALKSVISSVLCNFLPPSIKGILAIGIFISSYETKYRIEAKAF